MKTNIVNWIPYCNICGKPTQEITSTTGGVCRGHPNIEDELDDILKQFDIDAIADYWKSLADKRLSLLKEYKVLLMMIINQRKASVGGLENIYMPQLNREYIDKSCAELAEAIAEE